MKLEILSDQVSITCVICGEVYCHAPAPADMALDQIRDMVQPFMKHVRDRHPDMADQIKKSVGG